MNNLIVYCITNKINKRKYVGITRLGMLNRWKSHVVDAKNKRFNIPLHNAIRKYGKNNFIIKKLQSCTTLSRLKHLEIYWIKKLNTYNEGYNATLGGDGAIGAKWNRLSKLKQKLIARKRGFEYYSLRTKRLWLKNRSKYLKKLRSRPVRKKNSESKKVCWKNPKIRNKQLRGIRKYWLKPSSIRAQKCRSTRLSKKSSWRKANSKSKIKAWSNPVIRARQSAAIRKAHRKIEFRKAVSRTMRRLWRNKYFRKKQIAAMRKHGKG